MSSAFTSAASPDINECALNTDGCAATHYCDNTAGSFECVPCPDGYGADADGLDCSGMSPPLSRAYGLSVNN